MPLSLSGSGIFNGQRFELDSVLLGRGDELDLRTPTELSLLAVVVEADLLQPLWQRMYQKPLAGWLEHQLVVPARPAAASAPWWASCTTGPTPKTPRAAGTWSPAISSPKSTACSTPNANRSLPYSNTTPPFNHPNHAVLTNSPSPNAPPPLRPSNASFFSPFGSFASSVHSDSVLLALAQHLLMHRRRYHLFLSVSFPALPPLPAPP